MTGDATPRPSFGLALGGAARKVGKLHRLALAEYGTDFPTWMLLTLLAEQRTPRLAEDVIVELDRRMELPRADAVGLLARTAADGLVTYAAGDDTPGVALTGPGAALYADLYAHARSRTDAAYADVDPATLDATISTLLTIDARATALLTP